MPTTTTNWGLPLYSDTDSITPIQNSFNAISNALETGLNAFRLKLPMNVASQAERDALFASPTQGARVFRNDLGYEECYFALYNASTNPGGALVAGWYPISANTGAFGRLENPIINSCMDIWQRGTSFSNPASGAYTADRFRVAWDGSGATRTISRVNRTVGEIAGVPGEFSLRFAQTVAGSGGSSNRLESPQEDATQFAGQQITFSYYAKATGSVSVTPGFAQDFGTGGSTRTLTNATAQTITTSYVRYSATVTIPSISGKTLGTGHYIMPYLQLPNNSTFQVDTVGWQIDLGPIALPFRRSLPNISGELLAAYRYYVRIVAGAGGSGVPIISWGTNVATTVADINVPLAIPMRANPTLAEVSGVGIYSTTNGSFSGGTITMSYTSQFSPVIRYTHGSAVLTVGSGCEFVNTGASAGFISISAEL